MAADEKKRAKALQKELLAVEKQEKKLQKAFVKAKNYMTKDNLRPNGMLSVRSTVQ